MNQPQEVIIYRGPAEYALYNNIEITFPVIVASILGLVATVIAYKIIESFFTGWQSYGIKGHVRRYGGLYVGGFVFAFIIHQMCIL